MNPAATRAPAQPDARTRLLDAAMQVIREQGYSATTVDDICGAAGVTKGAFFHHFKSKEDLGVAATAHFAEMAARLFRTAPFNEHADPLDRLLGYIDFRNAILTEIENAPPHALYTAHANSGQRHVVQMFQRHLPEITKKQADTASFKTPNLRNVLVTGPYFHDGSQKTLWDVMDHYNKGAGLQNPWLDEDIQPLALTEREIDDLVAFLASLTSPAYKELGAQELERQRALSKTSRPQRDTKRAFGPKPPRPKPTQP